MYFPAAKAGLNGFVIVPCGATACMARFVYGDCCGVPVRMTMIA